MIKPKAIDRASHPLSKQMLRAGVVWFLTLALCWQLALPVLASGRKERRDNASKSSRPKKAPAKSARRSAAQTNAANVTTISAASFESCMAPDSIMAAFGPALATKSDAATSLPLPTDLAGTTVTVRDSAENERAAQLFYVSPNQVNFLVPQQTTSGAAIITIISANGVISQGTVQVSSVCQGVFTANASGSGAPAANLFRLRNGQLISESLTDPDPAGGFKPRPIDPGLDTDRLFLALYLTGLRGAPDPNNDGNANENVRVIIGNLEIKPDYAGRQGGFEGLDQVNVELDRSLAGRGRLNVTVTVNGFNSSNVTEIEFGPVAGSAPPQITGFSAAEGV